MIFLFKREKIQNQNFTTNRDSCDLIDLSFLAPLTVIINATLLLTSLLGTVLSINSAAYNCPVIIAITCNYCGSFNWSAFAFTRGGSVLIAHGMKGMTRSFQ